MLSVKLACIIVKAQSDQPKYTCQNNQVEGSILITLESFANHITDPYQLIVMICLKLLSIQLLRASFYLDSVRIKMFHLQDSLNLQTRDGQCSRSINNYSSIYSPVKGSNLLFIKKLIST